MKSNILLTFGINGSLRKREVTSPDNYTEYYLFNSAANMKAYSYDKTDFAYYGYNASNTRTYKLNFLNANSWVNGQQQSLQLNLQQGMFYPNAYLTFNQNGNYTKHYYNGSERIASRLGSNTHPTDATSNDRLEYRMMRSEEKFRENIQELVSDGQPVDFQGTVNLNSLQPVNATSDIFYYHTNHLGSTAFVTDNNATVTQGFLYAPFGEITTEYNANFGNNVLPKYSFNAKELDEETGMYYYEARYYQPPVFTSRDPMFEKYFWMSPYAYCANNPVKYVDPSGCDIVVTGDDADEAVAQLNNNFSKNFVVTRNEDGTLSYTGKAKTRAEMLVQMAIDDDKITVNVEASNSNSFKMSDGSFIETRYGGGYAGNKYENGKVDTYQKVCPSMLEMYDRSVGDMVSGESMLHEVAESYYGGIIALKNKQSSPMAGVTGSTYEEAHKMANDIAIGDRRRVDSDKFYISGYSQTNVGGNKVLLPDYKRVEYERCR